MHKDAVDASPFKQTQADPARAAGPQEFPPFATVAETCETLRISRATACRYIASGKLQAAKFGRTVRVRTASILILTLAA